ncbi:PEP-CTERM sorting domain-containing protein [Aquabacterium sp. A3]|uniref:PEP-CTERM sorting domain-containing protein n=1 Tax=Aquabacterium sp. A3 TaxID=3132829 RepID=UPI003119480D
MKQLIVWALASLVAVSASADAPPKDKKDNFNPIAFANANDNALLNSNVNSAVSPVPEADTIAMLIAGVAVVGVVVARRRKK